MNYDIFSMKEIPETAPLSTSYTLTSFTYIGPTVTARGDLARDWLPSVSLIFNFMLALNTFVPPSQIFHPGASYIHIDKLQLLKI